MSRVFPCYVNCIYQSKTCESDTGNVQISRLFNSLLVGKPQIVSHFLQISYGRLTTSVHTAVIAIISKVQKIFDCLINILIFFSSLNSSYTANKYIHSTIYIFLFSPNPMYLRCTLVFNHCPKWIRSRICSGLLYINSSPIYSFSPSSKSIVYICSVYQFGM